MATRGISDARLVVTAINVVDKVTLAATPSVGRIGIDTEISLTATVTDKDGDPIEGATVAFNSTNKSVVGLGDDNKDKVEVVTNAMGEAPLMAMATGGGSATITAMSGAKSASKSYTVTGESTLYEIRVLSQVDSNFEINVGGTISFEVAVYDLTSGAQVAGTLTWTSDDDTVINHAVTSGGLTNTLTISGGPSAGTTTVTVSAAHVVGPGTARLTFTVPGAEPYKTRSINVSPSGG